MKPLMAFTLACLLALPVSAARIKDMSLSPEESFQQPNIIHSPAPGGGQAGAPTPIGGTNPSNETGNRFMDGYCDPSVRPVVSGVNTMQNCLQEARLDACNRFQKLPADAQNAADRAISCGNLLGEPRMMEIVPPEACRDNDRQMILLLKKYWTDQDTAQALVFLPDKVNNPTADCAGK